MVEKKRVKESLSTAGKDGGFLIRADDFHLVFETIPEGVVVIEARGRIVYANRAAEKILGIKKKGASGKTYDDPQWKITDYDGAPLPKTKLPFYLVVKTKKPVRGVRHAIETEKGKRIFLTVNASPMFDRNGKIRAVAASVSDVTESIKNERKLKESEEKYRKLMQNANDAIFAADAETGKIIDVNKKAVELSGRSRKELIGMNRSKLHPSGCAGKYRKMFDFHAKADRSSVQNLILEKKNGERVSVDISATHMDLKGRRVVLGIFRDVSERKMFEEKLIKERNTAREYLHIAGTIIIALDEKGGIRLINRKGCELLGCSEDSAVGKNWFENYIPAHDRLKVKSMYRKTMRGAAGMPEYFENDIISGDKVIRRVAWHNRVIRDKKGKICGAISSGEDITEKKKAQEEIKSSREWFATTLSSIGDGVITANAKGRIQFMNPVACRLTGWKEKDAKGRELKEVFEIVNEVSGKKVKNPAAEVLKKGTIQGLANHTVLINKKGKKIPIEDSAAPIKGSGGKMTGAVLIFHDVTQRRSAERAIKRSEENYRRLFSGISDAVYVYRATTENVGKFIAVNDAACGMTGYTKKELENMSIKDLDEILDYKEAEKAERIMKKGKSFIHESAHKRKDGSKVPVEINSRYLDIEGKRAVLSIVRDISERARIRSREEEINRYNFMRARLWEAAGKAGAGEKELAEYFMKVLGGNLNASNVVYFRLSGGKNHAEAEWRSGEKKRSFMKVKMSGEARRAMEKKQYIYESDKKQNKIPPALKRFFESLEKIKNRPCRMLLTPVFTGREIHGAVVCFCGEDFAGGDDSESGKTAVKEAAAIFGNILEKKRTEQILRESEEKFRSISEQSILGVLILQDGIIRYINKGMSEIIEKNPRDVAGKHIAVLKKTVHPESRRAFERMFEKDSTGAVPTREYKIRFISRKHENKWAAVYVRTAMYGGSPAEFISAADISGLKQVQEKLLKTVRELEQSNAELEKFAYVASHDLQEPLRMVSNYVQLLEFKYSGRLEKDACEFIKYAVEGTERMRELINDLLAYSRLGTSGKKAEYIDLNDIVDEAVSDLREAVKEKNAGVKKEKLPGVWAEKTMMLRLFQNLILNALKFGKKNIPPEITVSAREKKKEWVIIVKDNGIGIKEDYFDKIFVIFQRLHSREDYEGTGMGLAICKKIVERHGGRIWVESKQNEGASFCFTLPKSPPDSV